MMFHRTHTLGAASFGGVADEYCTVTVGQDADRDACPVVVDIEVPSQNAFDLAVSDGNPDDETSEILFDTFESGPNPQAWHLRISARHCSDVAPQALGAALIRAGKLILEAHPPVQWALHSAVDGVENYELDEADDDFQEPDEVDDDDPEPSPPPAGSTDIGDVLLRIRAGIERSRKSTRRGAR